MKEKFETPKFDIRRKLQTFFESCGWREDEDPWQDEKIRGMCGRHNIAESDMRAVADELRREHMDEVMKEARQENFDRTPPRR